MRNDGSIQFWKARALGKIVKQKALPMEVISAGNGAGILQQGERRSLAGATGLDHRFVLGCIFVGAKQNFIKLIFDGCRALARHQRL